MSLKLIIYALKITQRQTAKPPV